MSGTRRKGAVVSRRQVQETIYPAGPPVLTAADIENLRQVIEPIVRNVLREEFERKVQRRSGRRCGTGINNPPKCMGSAASGPDYCTCVGGNSCMKR